MGGVRGYKGRGGVRGVRGEGCEGARGVSPPFQPRPSRSCFAQINACNARSVLPMGKLRGGQKRGEAVLDRITCLCGCVDDVRRPSLRSSERAQRPRRYACSVPSPCVHLLPQHDSSKTNFPNVVLRKNLLTCHCDNDTCSTVTRRRPNPRPPGRTSSRLPSPRPPPPRDPPSPYLDYAYFLILARF